jgi:NADPH-dependent 7-cyano-7-deazaguanine reductase QueF
MELETMPNLRRDIALEHCHIFDLPQMCPVSGNPQPGSQIRIEYTAGECFLEDYAIAGYIASFVGGRSVGGVFIRDMEQTIQTIAAAVRDAVRVPVVVKVSLILDSQRQEIVVRAPQGETC